MKYLVYASGAPGFASWEEAVQLLEGIVLPSLAALEKLEKKKKILAGGLPVSDRAFVFIAEAASNEELDAMLLDIPLWGALQWEVTPLLSFAGRAAYERERVKKFKSN